MKASSSPRSIALVPLALLLSCSCGPGGPFPPGPSEPRANTQLLAAFADRVEREGLAASWERSAGALDAEAPSFGLLPLLQLRQLELEALARALPGEEDLRRIAMVRRRALWLRAETDPELVAALRAIDRLRGASQSDDPALHRVLLESEDSAERREAWLDLHGAAPELAPWLRAATQARGRWARRQGRPDFLELMAAVEGLRPGTLERLVGQVELALRQPPEAPLGEPWDAEAVDPELARSLAAVLDAGGCLARARRSLAWAGLEENPPGLTVAHGAPGTGAGYSANASFAVEPPADVRLLVVPDAGLAAHWRVLHEHGHAAQALLAPPEREPLLRRVFSGAVSEACAKIFERLAFAPEWLEAEGLPPGAALALARWEGASERARGRRILADLRFEAILHASPESDLDAAHAELWAELAGLRAVPGLPAWAAERSFAYRPGERAQYLLARCAQAAVYRRLRAQPGGLLGAAAGRILREEVLRPAAGASYEEWFERAAGEPPSCKAWIQDVARPELE